MSLVCLLCIKYITIPHCFQNKVEGFQRGVWRVPGFDPVFSAVSSLATPLTLYSLESMCTHHTIFTLPCAWTIFPHAPPQNQAIVGLCFRITSPGKSCPMSLWPSQLHLCVTASLDLLQCRASQYICPSLPHNS